MAKSYFGLLPILLMVGCAPQLYIPPRSTAHYQRQLSDWVGKNVSEIPASWGTPTLSTGTASVEGMKEIAWPNTPRWGCTTTAVTDSSNTIRSWDLNGPDCMTGYSEKEIEQIKTQYRALQAVARKLKSGTPIHLAFYEDAVEIHSNREDDPLDCYFVSYSSIVQEITIRTSPLPKHGYVLAKDSYIYELRFVSDIQIIPAVPPVPPGAE